MQRNALIPLLAAGILSATSPAAFAQSNKSSDRRQPSKKETVVIKDDQPETVIEIRNGKVYLNGELVAANNDEDVYKKIIIRKDGARGNQGFMPFEEDPATENTPAEKRALLGVLTDTRDGEPGALVKEVTPNSPAEKAGIRAGDRILSVGGRKITDAISLVREIGSNHQAGDEITIEYDREGRNKTTAATLAAAPQRQNNVRMRQFNPQDMNNDTPPYFFRGFSHADDAGVVSRPKIGVSVEDRTDGNGVTVIEVMPSSAAAMAGLKKDDVITRMGDERLESVTDLQDKVSHSKPGDHIQLKYRRNGKDASAELILPRTINRRDL